MALPLKIDVLPEPELEFANAARDVDPRRGLGAHGPVDDRGLRRIRLGFVGLPEDIEAAKTWLNRLGQFIPAFEGNSNRFRDWPGLEDVLNCQFVVEDIDVLALHPHGLSQRALRQADRLHEFLDQNFTDRRRLAFCHQHGLPHRDELTGTLIA